MPPVFYLKKEKRKLKIFPFIVFALIGIIFIVAIDTVISPIARDVAEFQGKIACSDAVNHAILYELEQLSLDYDDLVTVTKADDNTITAIQTNALLINYIKERIENRTSKLIEENAQNAVSIPVGVLTGIKLFSGVGPKLNLQVIPLGTTDTRLSSNFSSAGINQTLHQIKLDITANFICVFAGNSVRVSTNSNFIVAETVIVGKIPNTNALISH